MIIMDTIKKEGKMIIIGENNIYIYRFENIYINKINITFLYLRIFVEINY